MSLQIPPGEGEPIEQAKRAVAHVLKRIRDDANVGYRLGIGTQSFELLVQAGSALFGHPVEKVQADFSPRGDEQDLDVPRHEIRNLLDELEQDIRTLVEQARERGDDHPEWDAKVTVIGEVANRLRGFLGKLKCGFFQGQWVELIGEEE